MASIVVLICKVASPVCVRTCVVSSMCYECLAYMHARYPQRSKEGIEIPRTEVTDSCELPCGCCWELTLALLQECWALTIAEPSL